MGNDSIFGNDHNSRQTPEEMAAALSQAVDDLDLTAVEDTQVWAEDAAVDLSPNLTNKTQNNTMKSQSGTEGPIDEHPNNSASTASLPRNTSMASNASSVKSTQSKGPFICDQCQKHCASKSGLKSHLRVHK